MGIGTPSSHNKPPRAIGTSWWGLSNGRRPEQFHCIGRSSSRSTRARCLSSWRAQRFQKRPAQRSVLQIHQETTTRPLQSLDLFGRITQRPAHAGPTPIVLLALFPRLQLDRDAVAVRVERIASAGWPRKICVPYETLFPPTALVRCRVAWGNWLEALGGRRFCALGTEGEYLETDKRTVAHPF